MMEARQRGGGIVTAAAAATATAFIPMSHRSISSSFTSNNKQQQQQGGEEGQQQRGRLRRLRPDQNPESTVALAEAWAKAGKLVGYDGSGSIRIPSSSSSSTSSLRGASTDMSSSSSQSVVTQSDDNNDKENDALFPLMGKKAEDSPPRMRFAPSPTGSLHVGGARTALYNWLAAKKGQLDHPNSNAGFIIRVEDTDVARSTKESEESVLADLRWLGLHWDEGPDNVLAPYGPYRQSERSEIYTQIAQRLLQEGKAYPCFCTQAELDEMKLQQEAQGIPPRYDGTWRDADPILVQQKMDEGIPYTIRFKVPSGARVVIDDAVRGTVSWDAESTVGDFILLRSGKNSIPVYNFCVAIDDAAMGITTVVRAEEHLTNTLRQALILDALNVPRPRYAHCSLILGEDKQKLSKRHGATSCNQYRLEGFLPDAMINYLALLGWNDGSDNEIFTREELIDVFDISRVVKSPSVFDMDKLKWVNSQHLKMMSVEELMDDVIDQFHILGLLKQQQQDEDKQQEGDDTMLNKKNSKVRDFAFAATSLAKQMMETTRDAATNAQVVLGYSLPTSFDEMEDDGDNNEAKEMIKEGYFFDIATTLVHQFQNNQLPLPDPLDPLAAFTQTQNDNNKKSSSSSSTTAPTPIVEDSEVGGTPYSFPQAYKSHMKQLSKELNVKGKYFFHPLRLALTGEMSGQDVTKQLSLLSLASSNDDDDDAVVIDSKAVGLVSLKERIHRLDEFCHTIPEEYRIPKSMKKNKKTGDDNETSSTNVNGVTTTSDSGNNNNQFAKKKSSNDDPLQTYDGPPITALDIRVGRITNVWEHPEADKLYCEEVDIGEDEEGTTITRQIASGLRPYMTSDQLKDRLVLVLCNLKARKMVGFESHGMILCASNEDHTNVRLVSPPVDAVIGERITIPGLFSSSTTATTTEENEENENDKPFAENKMGKKKIFEKLAPYLVTNEYGVPEFLGRPFMTSAGVCTSPIPKGNVS